MCPSIREILDHGRLEIVRLCDKHQSLYEYGGGDTRAYHHVYYVVDTTGWDKIERNDDYAECDDSTSERLARSLDEG